MAISKDKKKEIIEKLKKIFSESPSVAFVQFNKLTVANAQALRRTMREAGSGYYVAKKTLIRKSLEGGKVTGELPALNGEVALAYLEKSARPNGPRRTDSVGLRSGGGHDVTAPAREVFGLEKQLEKTVRLIGGIFEGRFLREEEIRSLAAIPSRQTLLAQLVKLVNSPIQRFVVGLSEVAKSKQG